MNEQRVDLPSGGRAWITTVPTHAQAKVLRRNRLHMVRYAGETGWRPELTPDERDILEDLILESTSLTIRTLTLRWEGVRAPSGDELVFPDGIDDMAEPDAQALFDAITEIEKGPTGADPNAEGSTSGSSLPPESDPAT